MDGEDNEKTYEEVIKKCNENLYNHSIKNNNFNYYELEKKYQGLKLCSVILEYSYRPGNIGYQMTKKHFEQLKIKLK